MVMRRVSKVLIDSIAWTLVLPIAYFLRLELNAFDYLPEIAIVTAISFPVKLGIVWLNRHHNYSWRYAGMLDSAHILSSIVQFTVVFLIAASFLRPYIFIPISVPIIEAVLSLLMFIGIRASTRIYMRSNVKGILFKANTVQTKRKVLIAGAGEAGTLILKSINQSADSDLHPVGFIDDDPIKQRQRIAGLKMLGTIEDLPIIAHETEASEVIIAMPSATGAKVRQIVELARKAKIRYRIIPSLTELINREPAVNQLRDVRIEDLLGREPVELDNQSISYIITNRRVLVTGAGGSIGSEIVRQLLPYNPKEIVLLGRGENSLHQLMLELERDYPHQKVTTKVCNIRDTLTLGNVFETFKPQVVFHAAAHKHVRLMEENPSQAVFNNVLGTRNVVKMALKHKVECFVNVSTDKAINPTSVMGACKRVTELIVQDAAQKAAEGQYFMSVRFGNVLGSRGSVVPIFQEQIRRGGPVTVTHENMVRYFMTIPEASQLVLQAAALHLNGCVFVLKMGEPVRIVDMAKDLIRLSGLEPDKDIHIVFTGLQKGEKLYEELVYNDEDNTTTAHDKVLICETNGMPDNLEDLLKDLSVAAEAYDHREIRRVIKLIVPTYSGFDVKKELMKAM